MDSQWLKLEVLVHSDESEKLERLGLNVTEKDYEWHPIMIRISHISSIEPYYPNNNYSYVNISGDIAVLNISPKALMSLLMEPFSNR